MISSDQLVAQLRILLPALGVLAAMLGWASADKINAIVAQVLIVLGPLSIVGASIWSLFANSRASIMASAAKPVDANTPPPQIVLPKEEEKLAQSLPGNVTSIDLSQPETVVKVDTDHGESTVEKDK